MQDMDTKYYRLSIAEREEISRGLRAGEAFTSIAERLRRPVCTITREVWRNTKRKRCYRAAPSQERAAGRIRRGRKQKIETNGPLKEYVYGKLKAEWSPEEIANRMRLEYPDDTTMRISHETIYCHIYCLPKGELKKELMRGLRRKRRQRYLRRDLHDRKSRLVDAVSIDERPEEAASRQVPGHWEGDLLMGKERKSAIGTLVERTTRLTLLVPLGAKNATVVRQAFAKAFKRIPKQFAKTLTYDRGSEMAEHSLFTEETKIGVYFADAHCPWQRGTNENTNGLIRQYFPKGTDFSCVSLAQLRGAERRLNGRPRKALGFYTPSERFYEFITGKKIALEV
jgi:transposase, IS30 family